MLCFFQAEDGIRDLVRSRGLGDVYKRQGEGVLAKHPICQVCHRTPSTVADHYPLSKRELIDACLLYTSDAADERSSVDLGGRRIIKKKKAKATEGSTRRQLKPDVR